MRKRLSRQESKEVTHMRLIEAAERLFIRKGFDDVSVDEISERAGYSRGAFYSNFENKEQIFLAVIERRRLPLLKALDDTFQRTSEPMGRIAAVREWFSRMWRLEDFVALEMEFSRTAMKDRRIRDRLTEIRRQELETFALYAIRYFNSVDRRPDDRPEVLALALWAVVRGLGALAIETGPEWEELCAEAFDLAFERITALQIS